MVYLATIHNQQDKFAALAVLFCDTSAMYLKQHCKIYFYLLFFCLFVFSKNILAAEIISIPLQPELETDLTVQAAKGDTLLLVFPSEYGPQQADTTLLQTLPQYGIEVWLSNPLESYFLPHTASNLEKIPAKDIQQLIQTVHKRSKKNIIILSSGRGAIPVLRALASWPDKFSPEYVTGLILMHPRLFTKTPEPGLKAKLMPSVSKTNQLIYLIQPNLSPFWWNKNISLQGLQQSGSDVFVQVLRNIRNRFYFREDANAIEQQLTQKYPNIIYNAINQLTRYPKKQRTIATGYTAKKLVTSIKQQQTLSPYKGKPVPPPLKLKVLTGSTHDLTSDKNKVVLVNFWASWCPPCVHEMPSMQRLENYFNKKPSTKEAFKILAVNMAEDEKTITTFLKTKVAVKFDILLDSNGIALKQWQVFAFPTSFIIGKQGNIRYAIYGGLDWFDQDIIQKIQQLIDE